MTSKPDGWGGQCLENHQRVCQNTDSSGSSNSGSEQMEVDCYTMVPQHNRTIQYYICYQGPNRCELCLTLVGPTLLFIHSGACALSTAKNDCFRVHFSLRPILLWSCDKVPSILQYRACLIIENRFENSPRSKLRVHLIVEVLEIAMWNIRFFLKWLIIGGVLVKPYIKGIQSLKLVKWVFHFITTLFWRYWIINRYQINSIWRYL